MFLSESQKQSKFIKALGYIVGIYTGNQNINNNKKDILKNETVQLSKVLRKSIFTQLHLPSFHIFLMKNEMESSPNFTGQRFLWPVMPKFYILVFRL